MALAVREVEIKNSDRNLPLTGSSFLETLSGVSICEDGGTNLFFFFSFWATPVACRSSWARDQSHCSDNAGSLTHCATRELQTNLYLWGGRRFGGKKGALGSSVD